MPSMIRSHRGLCHSKKGFEQHMNYKPKNQVKVGGRMSEKGADRVGNKLANAAIIFASQAGLALILAAIKWW